MKKTRIIGIMAITVLALFIACVKDLENEGIYTETELIGTVVEKSTMQPIEGVTVQVTDGQHVHATTVTNSRGAFSLKDVNFEECSKDYYLWVDGSPINLPSKQEKLKGFGNKVFDYKTLILYDKTNVELLPQVTTDEISDIMALSAKVKGTVTADGGHDVTTRGVCYALHQTPTIEDTVVTAGSGKGSYTCSLTGLAKETTYYARAFATNSIGTTYGQQKMITTRNGEATITTTTATEITATSALVGGKITDNGGAAITERGICWATTANPTVSDNHTTNGSDTGTYTQRLQQLETSTTYYYRAYATNVCGTTYGQQRSFTTTSGLPTLTTTSVSNITATTAKSGGNITDNGGFNVTARGVCWNTTGNPDINDQHTTNGSGNGTFTSNITNLTNGATYHVRAYATNTHGTSYGNDIIFTTSSGSATITIDAAANITATSASCSANITNDGGATITERGICWSTSQNPTKSGTHVAAGGGTGNFSASMSGLSPSTTYYVRAYATNVAGTSYSLQISFTTTSGLPTVSTTSVSNITATTAKSGGNITNNGGFNVTARGVCWNTTGNPDINDQHTTNGSGNGTFTSNITNLTNGATYHVRAYATNSHGTSYGNEVSFTTSSGSATITIDAAANITATSASCSANITNDGGATITERGICWSTSQNPTKNSSHVAAGSGTGNFSASMSGLSPSTTYYVRAYATNVAGTSYSSQISFATANGLPTVTTGTVGSITATSAVCSGNVTADGGFTVTAKGICWSTSQYPTISGNHSNTGSGVGSFNGGLSNLSVNTTYYVRAYATNSVGTVYGSQVSFTTANGLPTVTTTTPTINGTTVATGGNVTSDGGFAVIARGICYGSLPYPDLTGNYSHTSNGSGTGYYSSSFSLPHGSGLYYIRAYATNANGTTYGPQVTVIQPYDTLPSFTYNGHTYKVAPDPGENMNHTSAQSYCNTLSYCGYSDWILPDEGEMQYMCTQKYIIGGFNIGNTTTSAYLYWTSTDAGSIYKYVCMGNCTLYSTTSIFGVTVGNSTSYGYNNYGNNRFYFRVRPIRLEN